MYKYNSINHTNEKTEAFYLCGQNGIENTTWANILHEKITQELNMMCYYLKSALELAESVYGFEKYIQYLQTNTLHKFS